MAKDQASSQTQPVDQRAAETIGGRQVSTSSVGGAAGTTGTSGSTAADFEAISQAAQNAGRSASGSGNRITISGGDKVTGYEVTLQAAPAQGGYKVVSVKGADGKDTQRVSIFELDGVVPLDTITGELGREEREARDKKRAEEEQKKAQEKAAQEEALRRQTSSTQPPEPHSSSTR